RAVFQVEYAHSFEGAHFVWVADPYDQSKIEEQERFSSQALVDDLNQGLSGEGVEADLLPPGEKGIQAVAGCANPGDVIAVLSNGGFDGFIPNLLKALKSIEDQSEH